MRLLRSHPNYFFGFLIWVAAIASVLAAPKIKIFKKTCAECTAYSSFVNELSVEQKEKIEMFEAGVVNVNGKFFFIGESSTSEFDLNKKGMIFYETMIPTIEEKTRRLMIVNSCLRSLDPAIRELILGKKAIFLFRNNEFVIVGDRTALTLTGKDSKTK